MYTPPTKDMSFVLRHVIKVQDLPGFDQDIDSLLEPAAQWAAKVLAPLNHAGDKAGATLKDGQVTTAPGFKEAYAQFTELGLNGSPFPEEYGGLNLPWALTFALNEMIQGANMAFGLAPLLNQGAIDAILYHGSDAQKAAYLTNIITGKWTGTMNLTEPQAGSDLSKIRTSAQPQPDGSYKIVGQKIYITYGDHDMTDNIIHLVLARTPGAPEGVKGISLFIVPKFLQDGSRNDVQCTGIEHKLGIHASPTCTMQYGDKGGATGYLVGKENEGLKYMFTMMNNARLSVGLQGVAVAEAAYQKALSYAKDRVQGTSLTDKGKPVAIIDHADVKRTLMTMAAKIMAARALTYEAAYHLDRAKGGDAAAQGRVDLLTPIVKSWATDMAVEVTSLGVQVHGGMGYVEETGAAQYLRDARILPIYEGTNGIQAMDLVFRKVAGSGGTLAQEYIKEMKEAAAFSPALMDALTALFNATAAITGMAKADPESAAAEASPYLTAFGIIAGGVMMERRKQAALSLMSEDGQDIEFLKKQVALADFYNDTILPQANAALTAALQGGVSVKSFTFGG